MARTTMYDVAREAGVSHQTVSRVVNGAPNVRPETLERVRAVMERLDYRPSASARNLAARRTHVLGVVSFTGLWFGPTAILHSLEVAARRHGYVAHLASVHGLGPDAVEEVVNDLLARDVEGVVVLVANDAQAELLAGLADRLPVVAVEGRLVDGVPYVGSDNEAGGALVAEHLTSLGHSAIAHVTGPADWAESRLRTAGWAGVLTAAGHLPAPVVPGDWGAESGFRAGQRLLREGAFRDGVTAVFAANDPMALGVLAALHQADVRMPEEVSVVGYDNTPESGWFFPSLTTVEQQFDTVGAAAIDQLVSLVEGGIAEAEILVPPRLVRRSSTAAPGAPFLTR